MESREADPADEAVGAIDEAQRLIASVFGAGDFAAVQHAQLVDMLDLAESIGRRIDAARVSLAAEVDERSRRELGDERLCVKYGCRTASDMLTRATGVSAREAARRVKLGGQLRRCPSGLGSPSAALPTLAAAFHDGRIGVDSAEAIATGLVPIRHRCDAQELAAAERALVTCATGDVTDENAGLPGAGMRFASDLVRGQVEVWRARLDPDGAAPDSAETQARSRIGFGHLKDGVYPLRGAVTPDLRGIMNGIFEAYLSPRTTASFPSEKEQREQELSQQEQDAPGALDVDNRPIDEKRADVLRGVFELAARHAEAPTIGGAAPTVMVHVNASDLVGGEGVGWVDGVDAPVPLGTVRQMICAGGYQQIVIGERGEVLHLGARQRLFSTAQRKAIIARDGGCVIPGCGAPMHSLEVHHVVPWRHDEKTDIDNGVLLCWFHHHEIERSGWEIRMVEGRPYVKAPPWLDRTQSWRPAAQHRAAHASGRAA
ncbi:DUF222 domain-containing protein [Microbacterium sp. STN6]|uniref:HNH endonuclease signature motif containing protein n=1 Tax=Microbacterium sp. STN6 TaxID=2995588 RepID=UPI002260C778|nr:HNH endonuclease signature motif containing protein [Microbacterium sp. STN6]MCX7521588.1 DUF222 domain-containing protein [Microbacterium sp. STN6]